MENISEESSSQAQPEVSHSYLPAISGQKSDQTTIVSGQLTDYVSDILLKAALVFKGEGVTDLKHLKAGLLTLIAMNSASLGDPLVLILIGEDLSRASKILETATKLTPEELQLQFSRLSPETLQRGGDDFKNKTVIGFDASVFAKGQGDLSVLSPEVP